jgi:hypothetical protein
MTCRQRSGTYRQRGVLDHEGRVSRGPTRISAGNIVDVGNNKAAVPVARVEPVADAHRMMTAVRGAFPGRLFATGIHCQASTNGRF